MVRDAHAIYFSGMLQGCLYGNDGRQEEGATVQPGQTTPLLELILEKQVVGGDSARRTALPASLYEYGVHKGPKPNKPDLYVASGERFIGQVRRAGAVVQAVQIRRAQHVGDEVLQRDARLQVVVDVERRG